MRPVRVLPAGTADRALLPPVARAIGRELGTSCSIAPDLLDLAFARHPERTQYHSTAIIDAIARTPGDDILLAVTDLDLYIPILTFVFGEAQLGGRCAVVSYHRLTQEFYGLEPDQGLLIERLIKESVHELGHTLGMTHCDDYECVMAASYSVEWIDMKGSALCGECRQVAQPVERRRLGR